MKTKQQYLLISSSDNQNIGLIKIGPLAKRNIIKSIVEIEEKLKSALRQHYNNDNVDISEVLNSEEINAMFEIGKKIEVELAAGWSDEQDIINDKVYIETTWLLA